MDARFYNSEEIDIERLANDLVNAYKVQGYQAQQIGSKDQVLVQLKKGGDFEAIIGMQAALSVTIQRTSGGVLAMIGQQKWLDKAAVGAVGVVLPLLWPLAVTAGVGAIRQASLGNQVLNMVDGLVRQQQPNVQVGPAPHHLQQQWGPSPHGPGQQPSYGSTPAYMPPQPPPGMSPMPMPPRSGLRCMHCNTPFEPGDTFCTGCGRSLAPPKRYCTNCNFEVKPGVSFCPKCGASTFQAQSAASPVPPVRQAPPVSPAPTPSYTPTPAPTYTPPAQAVPPPAPTYTPPPKPQTPVYIPSNQQPPLPTSPTIEYNAPTVQAQPTPPIKPEEPYYVPPVTQDPSVAPQPHITIVPGAAKPQQPATPQPKKETVYYVPSSQAQTASQPPADSLTLPAQPAPSDQTEQQAAAETVYYAPPAQPEAPAHKPRVQQPAHSPAPPKPLKAKPAVRPSFDPSTSWGTLTFSNGNVVQLSGERAVAGRSDHDLGGVEPEIDLADMDGSDTVSRIHAVIEHIGSTYTLTDLNSTNATRINNKRLEPDKATPFNDGDTLSFGKVTCTFKKL